MVVKRKVMEVDDDNMGEEDKLEEELKQPKLMEGRLLEFEGAVHDLNFVQTYRS